MEHVISELEEMYQEFQAFAEDPRWRPLVESLEDPFERGLTAALLNNEHGWIQNLDEDVRTSSIANYEKYVFPIIRAVYPNLIATSIVSVQPMSAPTSLVFYLDAVYGTNKGSIKAGDTMLSAIRGHEADDQYSSERVEGEGIGTGDGAVASFTATLSFGSVRPGTLHIYVDGTEVAMDNGAGGLMPVGGSAVDPATSSVNYATGDVTVAFTAAPASGAVLTSNYDYNSEGSDKVPIVDFTITSSPVVARPHKLRAHWSMEAQINLKNVHGLDAEQELVALLSEKIRWDIDRTIISDLFRIARAGSVTFDRNIPVGASYSWNEHKQIFIDRLIEASNLIFRANRRGSGNFVICGTGVADIIESLYGFRPAAVSGNGVVFMGTLRNRWAVYKDPYLDENTFLVGYKGSSLWETGYVYAPYVPLIMTPTYMLDDMIGRKGLLSSYAKKTVNGFFYATGTVTT